MERWRLMAFVLVVMFQQPEARYQSVRCLVWCLKQGLYEFKIDVRLRVVMLREYLIGLTCVACGARRDWPNLPWFGFDTEAHTYEYRDRIRDKHVHLSKFVPIFKKELLFCGGGGVRGLFPEIHSLREKNKNFTVSLPSLRLQTICIFVWYSYRCLACVSYSSKNRALVQKELVLKRFRLCEWPSIYRYCWRYNDICTVFECVFMR